MMRVKEIRSTPIAIATDTGKDGVKTAVSPTLAQPTVGHAKDAAKDAEMPPMHQGGGEWLRREELKSEWDRIRNNSITRSIRGAAALFKGVSFPVNLMDPSLPENDPKYRRLLAAILGLDDLEEYFTPAEEDEDDLDDDASHASSEDDEA